jgi:hypothetical protein
MSKFKVGDEVQILDKSVFRDQGYNNGEKMRGVIEYLDSSGWWSVTWDNGFTNTYRDEDLEPYDTSTSELEENITFTVNGRTFNYTLCSTYYSYTSSGNDVIFNELGVDKDLFCSKVYGYEALDGSWPEWKYGDNEAPIKIIRAIREKIKEMESEPKIDVAEQPEENVTFTVNGETYNYVLIGMDRYYFNNTCGNNETIFNVLGVDKHRFCSEAYGYEAYAGGWPEWRKGDNEAPIKIVKAIREKIKQLESMPKSKKQTHKFKTGDKVTYKYQKDLLGQKYFHGGDCHGGFVGIIISIDYDGSLYVTTRHGLNFHMLPNEFVEYDEVLSKPIEYKFKVGDEVVGNSKATDRYCVTRTGWRGKVTKVNSDFFEAEGRGLPAGDIAKFDLQYEYFDLANSEPEETKYPTLGELIDKHTILEEAKRRYPVGTKYHAIGSDGIKYGGDSREEATYECRWVDSGLGIDCGIGYVYANGKWAEIVSETKYVVTQRTLSYPAETATFGTTKELPYTQTPIIINKKEKKQKIKVI